MPFLILSLRHRYGVVIGVLAVGVVCCQGYGIGPWSELMFYLLHVVVDRSVTQVPGYAYGISCQGLEVVYIVA